MNTVEPQVTVVVPTLNQGRFLRDSLESIFAQTVPCEVFVMDGGSTDDTLSVIKDFEPRLAGWRSGADQGQAAAINDGIALGSAPFVCWLNSDDWWLDGCLEMLIKPLSVEPHVPFSYGRVWNVKDPSGRVGPVWVSPFSRRSMAQRCLISQPGTLIRRSAWEAVGGLDGALKMAMDYDLWWKLANRFGDPIHTNRFVAVNRDHRATKTNTQRALHYEEASAVVRRHYGHVPIKWALAKPYAVWWRGLFAKLSIEASQRNEPPLRRANVRFPDR